MNKAAPVNVAVVGHTNAGKTSLMRTLLRDSQFGEVANAAGTTRHVQGGALSLHGSPAVALFDTPGLEDSIGLLAELDGLGKLENLTDGPHLLQRFLELQDRYLAFAQEAKVIRQILHNQLIFYVIDVREPLLGKYRDELTLLAYAAKPVIPVLNFVAQPRALTQEWKAQLARMQLHATVEFDNVVFRFDDEKRLLQKVQSLLGDHYELLQQLLDQRTQQWRAVQVTASRTIADTLLKIANLRLIVSHDEQAMQEGVARLQQKARQAEHQCLQTLLKIFGFARGDVRLDTLDVRQSRWQRDLFDRTQLRHFGMDAGAGAAKGAALGAGVDLAVGGLSLGTASALGALAGFLLSAGRRYGGDIKARFSNQQILCIEESTLKHLWSRQTALLMALQQRGHASQTVTEPAVTTLNFPDSGAAWLRKARSNPEWAQAEEADASHDRQLLLDEISNHIMIWLQQAQSSQQKPPG
jgi:predicted GTPase